MLLSVYRTIRYTLLWCLVIFIPDLKAQMPYQVVPLTAAVSSSPPSITVKWPQDGTAPFYKIRKKAPNDLEWQELATLPGTAEQYVDLDVQVGDVLEYTVMRSASLPIMDTLCIEPGTNVTFTIHDTGGNGLCCWNSDGFWKLYACGELIAQGARYEFQDQHQFSMCGTLSCEELVVVIYPDHQFEEISWEVTSEFGMEIAAGAPDMAPRFGYVMAGIETPATEQLGTILLLVDQQVAEDLDLELDRLKKDLLGEGWLVGRENVDPSAEVINVKQIVLNTADAHDLQALFLIGKVPVPYSGLIAPDEHEDHVGAWPADIYYAELDGPWTDEEVNWNSGMIQSRNHNLPGDGKFDQSTLPSDVDLIMGRVDLSDLPVFSIGEVELLRSYLDRDHAFRTGQLTFQRRALIDENFPWYDHESAAFRSCIPMFGETEVYQAPFVSTLSTESHLWAMAGGPGSYTSALGIGSSQDLADYPLKGAFAHVIGSYFGDWDVENNFMRSVLASGSMLGVVWGLQEITYHQMALGMPIGECVRRSQNSRYDQYERHGRLINMALMGDPTLPLLPLAQVQDLELTNFGPGIGLEWMPLQDDILGYNVYRRSDPTVHFERLNEDPITTASYLDPAPPYGTLEYMVRALKLEGTESGTYHVLSTGSPVEISFSLDVDQQYGLSDITVFPSPNQGYFTVRSANLDREVRISLLDLAGKEVPVQVDRQHNEFIVTTDAASGAYLLVLDDGSGKRLQRSIPIVR